MDFLFVLDYNEAGSSLDLLRCAVSDAVRNFKARARKRLAPTWRYLARREFGCVPVPESAGEAATLLDFPKLDMMFAFTNDGVGTKSNIAIAMSELLPAKRRFYWRNIGCDVVAANVNDLAAMGAVPLWILDDIQIGLSVILEDEYVVEGILDGLEEMCREERIAITGGETALMRDVVIPDKLTLSASAIGIVRPRSRVILPAIEEGDVIIGFPAPSLQTNGFTLARDIVSRLPEGYLTRFPSGRTVGEFLLRRSVTYTRHVAALLGAGIPVHYASHLSGGGWEKIRRAPQEFVYEITHVPDPPEIFTFLQKEGGVPDEVAYRTWNMGVGFVVFVPQESIEALEDVCAKLEIEPMSLGRVRKGPRRVRIAEKGIIL